MVYGIRNIVSEEVQEKLDIASLYYSIMNEDYSLFGEDYITEASFDFNKIRNTVKQKAIDAVKAVGALFEKLIGAIKNVFKKFKGSNEVESLDKLKDHIRKIKKVTIPKSSGLWVPRFNGKTPAKIAEEEVEKIKNKIDDVLKNYADKIVSQQDVSSDSDIEQLVNELKYKSNEDSKTIQNLVESFDCDNIFFESKESKDLTLNGYDLLVIEGFADDDNTLSYIEKTFSKMEHDLNKSINIETSIVVSFANHHNNVITEVNRKKLVDAHAESANKVFQSYVKGYSTLGSKLSAASCKYYNTCWSILKLALKSKDFEQFRNATGNNTDDVKALGDVRDGIAENDMRILRDGLAGLVYADLLFKDGLMDKQIRYARSKGMDPMESFKEKIDGENRPLISKSKKEFTDDDFAGAVYNLKNNFCRERINDLKTISLAIN